MKYLIILVLFISIVFFTRLIAQKSRHQSLCLHWINLISRVLASSSAIALFIIIDAKANEQKLWYEQQFSITPKRAYIECLLSESKYNVKYEKSPYSPSNFDDIVFDARTRYDWIINNKSIIIKQIDSLLYINLDSLNYPKCCNSREKMFMNDDSTLRAAISEYNAALININRSISKASKISNISDLWVPISYISILFSLAIFIGGWWVEYGNKK